MIENEDANAIKKQICLIFSNKNKFSINTAANPFIIYNIYIYNIIANIIRLIFKLQKYRTGKYA